MMLKLDRYKTWISKSNPFELETWVRALLVHYFFHVSDKAIVEVLQAPDQPSAARTVSAGWMMRQHCCNSSSLRRPVRCPPTASATKPRCAPFMNGLFTFDEFCPALIRK